MGSISADEAKAHRERLNARRQSVPSVSQMLGGASVSGINTRRHPNDSEELDEEEHPEDDEEGDPEEGTEDTSLLEVDESDSQ